MNAKLSHIATFGVLGAALLTFTCLLLHSGTGLYA